MQIALAVGSTTKVRKPEISTGHQNAGTGVSAVHRFTRSSPVVFSRADTIGAALFKARMDIVFQFIGVITCVAALVAYFMYLYGYESIPMDEER